MKLTDDQEVYNVFMNFRKTYKFIIHMHNKYKMNMHLGLSVENNHILGKTMETTARKFQKPFSEHVISSTKSMSKHIFFQNMETYHTMKLGCKPMSQYVLL
jgi:adenosine deaminase